MSRGSETDMENRRAGRLHLGFSRRYIGGWREFTVESRNLCGVINEMDRLYPGLGEHVEEETAVAIDGAIHETAYLPPIDIASLPVQLCLF